MRRIKLSGGQLRFTHNISSKSSKNMIWIRELTSNAVRVISLAGEFYHKYIKILRFISFMESMTKTGKFLLTLLILVLTTGYMGSANSADSSGGFIATGGSTGKNYNNNNYYGYAFQFPYTIVGNNTYGGSTGVFNLISAVAINYGGVSIVIWVYHPKNAMGSILSIYTLHRSYVPLIYVGTDGILYIGDWSNTPWQLTTKSPLTPGWHMIVLEEYVISASQVKIDAYLDGQQLGSFTLGLTHLFGALDNFPYAYIGTGYIPTTSLWSSGNGAWFFYNGTIALVAVYNYALPPGVVSSIYSQSTTSGNMLTAYLPVKGLVVVYQFTPNYFKNNNLMPLCYNRDILAKLGISSEPLLQLVSYGSNLNSTIWANVKVVTNLDQFTVTQTMTTTLTVTSTSTVYSTTTVTATTTITAMSTTTVTSSAVTTVTRTVSSTVTQPPVTVTVTEPVATVRIMTTTVTVESPTSSQSLTAIFAVAVIIAGAVIAAIVLARKK